MTHTQHAGQCSLTDDAHTRMHGHWFTFSPCRVARGIARMAGANVENPPCSRKGMSMAR